MLRAMRKAWPFNGAGTLFPGNSLGRMCHLEWEVSLKGRGLCVVVALIHGEDIVLTSTLPLCLLWILETADGKSLV